VFIRLSPWVAKMRYDFYHKSNATTYNKKTKALAFARCERYYAVDSSQPTRPRYKTGGMARALKRFPP